MLTQGLIAKINSGATDVTGNLQVLSTKPVPSHADRFRLNLSDGESHIVGMLATQHSKMVSEGEIVSNTIVELKKYVSNEAGGKKMLIVLDLAIVQRDCEPIGNPAPLQGDGGAAPAPAAHASVSAPALAASSSSGAVPSYTPNYTPSYGAAPGAVGGGGRGGGGAGGPIAPADPGVKIMEIASLNPYQNRWTVKARVTNKNKKSWSNARGEGTLFNIELLDERGGEIQATFFKEACDKFFDAIEIDSVYTFSNGRLKVANKQYSSTNSDYEITFGTDAVICAVEDDSAIKVQFNFKKFDVLESIEPNSTVDIIGIVKGCGEPVEIASKKTGNMMTKRDITIVDDTMIEVNLTLWNEKAREDDAQWQNYPVVAIKKVKVSDFNGVSLSTLNSSQMMLQPDQPEAAAMHAWWHSSGAQGAPARSITTSRGAGGNGKVKDTSLKSRTGISAITEQQLGHSEKGDYIEVKAAISYIRNAENGGNDPWYVSDPESKCKCVEQSDGTWYCEKLSKTVETPMRRYILPVTLADSTGSRMVTLFNDQAEEVLGISADDMHNLKESGDEEKVAKVYKEANFGSYLWTLKVKQETYNDENRIKVVGQAMSAYDFVEESKQLIAGINAY